MAIKQSAAEFQTVVDTLDLVQDRILVLPGHSVDRGLPCLTMGADGYVSSVEPQAMGQEAIALYRLAVEGRLAEGVAGPEALHRARQRPFTATRRHFPRLAQGRDEPAGTAGRVPA